MLAHRRMRDAALNATPHRRPRGATWAVVLAVTASYAFACTPPPRSPPRRVVDIVERTPLPTASAPPAPTRYDPVGDAAPLLEDGIKNRERRRARLATLGDGYWSLALAEAGDASFAGSGAAVGEWESEVVVAERHANHLRVVHQGRGLRLTFYLRSSDFHEVTRREWTMLAPSGDPFRNGCGVTLPPGTIVSPQPARLDLRRLVHRSEWVEARGTLPSDAIDRVYDAPAPMSTHHEDCGVQGPTTLLDAPEGETVAKLTDDRRYPCEKRGVAEGGAQRIAVRGEGVTVVGYVPREQVLSHGLPPPRHFHGRGSWHITDSRFLFLWPNDAVYPLDSSAMVGRVTERALKVQKVGVDGEGMQRIRQPLSPWDFAVLRIDAATSAAADAKYAAWKLRARFTNLVVSGTATTTSVATELENKRTLIAKCYDKFLEAQPQLPVRFHVETAFAPSQAGTVITAPDGVDPDLAWCLKQVLASSDAALHATRTTFTLELSPSDLID